MYAIQGARVVVAPGRTLSAATVVVRDGTIVAVGADLVPPTDAEIIDGKGLTVYAGLIDPFTRLGMPKNPDGERDGGRGAGRDQPKVSERPEERGPGRPNLQVRADARAALLYQAPSRAELEKMRRLGFTSALLVPDGGVFRGTSALVHLGGDDPARSVLLADIAAHLSFDTAPGDVYPTSLMGVIALIRQTFEDARRQTLWKARWAKNPQGLERPPLVPVFDAVSDLLEKRRRAVFEADDTHAFGRIAALAGEFSLAPVVVGNGYEYEVIEELKKDRFPLIVPVAFPEAPHLEDEDAALEVTTKSLRRWDLAAGNLAALHGAGIPFTLTTYRLKNPADFRKNVAKAIARGLPADDALEAVTVGPARLLGAETILGTVETGKIADLILADGDLFAEKTQVKELFIDGQPIEIEEESKDFDPNAKIDPRGTWELNYAIGGRSVTRTWKIEGTVGSLAGTGETQAGKVPLSGLSLTGNKLTGSYTSGGSGTVEFKWIIKGDEVAGSVTLPDGQTVSLSGKRTAKPEGGAL